MSDLCPKCSSPGEVVTSVTVRTMGSAPRTVLVTRLCSTPGCHNKYIVLKPEGELTAGERERWYDP